MSRAIKVEEHVYQELYMLRTKGQTFSQIIEDMLLVRLKIFELFNIVEGQRKFLEWQEKKLQEALKK